MMRIVLTLLAIATALPALAAPQQVSPSNYRMATKSPFSGRTDGVGYDPTYKTPNLLGNGDGYFSIGPTYKETFAYGDGLGIVCYPLDNNGGTFGLGSGANTACNTTCSALSPPGKCVIGFANGGDLVACSGATADTCICQQPPAYDLNCATTLVAGDAHVIETVSGTKLAWYAIGGANMPDTDATSLDISGDAAADEGGELVGNLPGLGARPFYVGDDPGFGFCATVAVADVSGTDSFLIGFREAEQFNEAVDDYQELAAIGPESGNVVINTIDSNAATSTTDTTDNVIDGQVVTYCTYVGDAGAVTFEHGGGAPTTTASFTFEDGLAVVPFMSYLQDADITGEIDVTLWVTFFR